VSDPPAALIRLARADEYERIGELTVRAYRTGGALATDDDYVSVLADARGRAAHAEVYALLDQPTGHLQGTVTLCAYGTRYAQVAAPGELEFRMLAVDPDAGGHGLGSRLIAFCAEQGRARGLDRLVICVIETNTAALAIYDHLGFVRAPARDTVPRPGIHLLTLTYELVPVP
jgi:ribosomal protein S18 acetylase RimI-like enzyme